MRHVAYSSHHQDISSLMQQQAESRWASKRTWLHTQHAGETKVRTGSQSDTESAHKAASSKVATVAVNEAISDDETQTRWRVNQETGDLVGAVLKGIKIQCYKGP